MKIMTPILVIAGVLATLVALAAYVMTSLLTLD